MNVLTSSQMRLAEAACVERENITYSVLMERAGSECSEIIAAENRPCNVLVLCGKGKNGGDGFVIARHLSEKGFNVTVMLVCGHPKAEDAIEKYSLLDFRKIPVEIYTDNVAEFRDVIINSDITVECIFGTGFSGILDTRLSVLASAINNCKARKYAIDVPAGADCDKACAEGIVFAADETIAISALKSIHIKKPASEYCGKIRVANIGITEEEHKESGSDIISFVDDKEVKSLLPPRPSVSNKGTFGHVLNICGSYKMQGAAVLSASAACRMGAGLVTAAFPEKAYPAIASKLTEPLMLPVQNDENGFFDFSASESIKAALEKATAVLAGCGIGVTEGTKELIKMLISQVRKPLVLDADALNALCGNAEVLKASPAETVITPHPGEMSRLTGKSIEEILENPVKTALRFANEFNVTVVLKCANTVVCSPCCPVYINRTGNSGLAKGGSGDVLAGMLVSLLAQGMNCFEASCTAVYLHGLCADRLTADRSERFIIPSDIVDNLPVLLNNL